MKKLGAILLAGVLSCFMAVELAGCGGSHVEDFQMPEGGFDTSKDVTITFYHQMGGPLQNILNDYIAIFQKMYPNIHVEHTPQGDWDGVKTTIVTELQGGNHPNIAYCYADHVAQYNVANAVQPLNSFLADGSLKDLTVPTYLVDEYGAYLDKDGNVIIDEEGNAVVDGAEPVLADLPLTLTEEEQAMYNPIYFNEGYSFENEEAMYTLPWVKSTEMLFYNKTFFDANGLTPPKTWDEMETLCQRILEIDPKCVPFGYDSEENWFISMCEQSGSEYTSSQSPKFRFDNATNKAFVEKFKSWAVATEKNPNGKGYCTTSALSGVNYTSDLFTQKNIYMSIGSTGGATYNTDTSSESVPFEVGIAPVPQVDAAHTKLISQGPSVCIFKDSDPQKVLASWLFVKFFTTNPLYQTEVAMNNGYMPVLTQEVMSKIDVYTKWVASANGSNYLTAQAVKVGMEHEKDYFVSPAFYGSSDARTEVGLLMQSALLGTKSVDQAFTDAINNLKKYGK